MSPEAYLDLDRTESEHWWYVARRAIMRDTLARMNLPVNARILEVGSGTGGNLHMLAEFGRVTAVEMDATARALARAKSGDAFDIRAGVCPSALPFGEETFDLICLFDVLEHIEESTQTLASLRKHLAPGGRILIAVPAYQWLWSAHDRFLHHKRRYTARQIAREAQAAGLNVQRATYFNTLLFPLAVIARVKDRLLGRNVSSGMATPGPLLNRLLRAVFSSEQALLQRVNLPFGVSVLAILSAVH